MYVTAFLDLTESGRVPAPEGMPVHMAKHSAVRIFPAPGTEVDAFAMDGDEVLAAALAATYRCRLVKQGHAANLEFHPSADPRLASETEFYLPAQGRELVRREQEC